MVAISLLFQTPKHFICFDNTYLLNKDTLHALWVKYGKPLATVLMQKNVVDDQALHLNLTDYGELCVTVKAESVKEDEMTVLLVAAVFALHYLATYSAKMRFGFSLSVLAPIASFGARSVCLDGPVFDDDAEYVIRSNAVRSLPDDVLKNVTLPADSFTVGRYKQLATT